MGLSSGEELSLEQIKKLIRDFKKLGVFVFNIIGGEPLLRKDLIDIVRFGAKQGLMTNILTNATLLDLQTAQNIKKSGLSLFSLSLDGSNEAINSLTRGKGSFERILTGIANAISTGLPVMVKITLQKQNIDDLENIVRLLIEKRVSLWTADFAIPCGRAKEMSPLQDFSVQERGKIIEKIYELAQKFKKQISFFTMDKIYYNVYSLKREKPNVLQKLMLYSKGGCGVLDGNSIYINCDGSIRPCPFFPFVLPEVNIKTRSVIDVYRYNEYFGKLRDRKNLKGKCSRCKFSFICGGCRARIYAQTGDFFAEDASCDLFESAS